ncbi:MAG: hormogonium polysaccharide biosynthesis glycosyltransferase HpsE [Cyanobacteria bacterium J06631_9]
MPDFSVVICTYNGEKKVPQVLEKLREVSTGPKDSLLPDRDFQWEVVVVDNNSSDRTAAVVQQCQADWQSNALAYGPKNVGSTPLRYCFEPRQGLAFARRRAIRETQSPLIGFLDDDTLPTAEWVSAAVHFGWQHPEVGAYGSSIQGLYEVAPPKGFERIACCLAIINRGEVPFQYASDRGVLPAGAGMVIRRQAWLEQVPAMPQLTGVSANSLKAKGEDVETLSYIRRRWPVWHNPAMKLQHFIPKERLAPRYLQRLYWRIGISRYPLRRLNYCTWQWPWMMTLYFISDLKKLLWKLVLTRQIGTVERCEFALLLGSWLSPFYCRTIPTPMSANSQTANSQTANSQTASSQTIELLPSTATTTELQNVMAAEQPSKKTTVTVGKSSS